MNMSSLISNLLGVAVELIMLVVCGYAIPAIKQRIGAQRVEALENFVSSAVRYAEQTYTPEQWLEKKKYVSSYAVGKANEIGLSLSASDIDILIEAVVHELKHEG